MKYLPMTIFLSMTLIFSPLAAVEIVSLGSSCDIAQTLRLHGLRTTAYPFDWMLTTMQSLIKGFQDDFKNVLVPKESHKGSNNSIEDGYGLKFAHAFPTTRYPEYRDQVYLVHGYIAPHWRDSLEQVKKTFNRRLERLLQLLKNGVPVVLVRYDNPNHYTRREEAEQLITILKNKFPSAKVALVFIGFTPNFQKSWNLPNTQTLCIGWHDATVREDPEWTKTILGLANIKPQAWPNDANETKQTNNDKHQQVTA